MKRFFPIVATPVTLRDLLPVPWRGGRRLRMRLNAMYNGRGTFCFGSGAAALSVLLQALKKLRPDATEVVIPVYTATAVLFAVRQAGLTPVLCDISLHDFNMDAGIVPRLLNGRTLAVIPTHMFGIPMYDIGHLSGGVSGITVIEDAAQALGSLVDGERAGSFADASLLSFNRGKNLPAAGGGCVTVHREDIAAAMADLVGNMGIGSLSLKERAGIFARNNAFALAVRPRIYAAIRGLTAKLRERPSPQAIVVRRFSWYQSSVLDSLLNRHELFGRKRYENGMRALDRLKADAGLILPEIDLCRVRPAFNRLPLIAREVERLERIVHILHGSGFETSRMYVPLHREFPDLGYKTGDFSNAEFLAEHLITVPCHPFMDRNDIDRMCEAIRKA